MHQLRPSREEMKLHVTDKELNPEKSQLEGLSESLIPSFFWEI